MKIRILSVVKDILTTPIYYRNINMRIYRTQNPSTACDITITIPFQVGSDQSFIISVVAVSFSDQPTSTTAAVKIFGKSFTRNWRGRTLKILCDRPFFNGLSSTTI